MVDQSLQRVVHDAANYGAKKIRKRRDTISYHQKRWKNAIVPFVIDPSLGENSLSLFSFLSINLISTDGFFLL